MAEIAGWLRLTDAEKLRVLTALRERRMARAANATPPPLP
jgi:predicted Fe-S protein YdhL (DUF1289 family)